MGSKYRKLLQEFYLLSHNQSDNKNVNIQSYLKSKSAQFSQSCQQSSVMDWKSQLMQAYGKLKSVQVMRERMTVLCEQLVSQTDRVIKTKQLQIQMVTNQLNLTRSALQQQKQQLLKTHNQHQLSLQQQRKKTILTLQKLQQKQYEIRELQQKLQQYEQQIQQIKSTEYQHMINTIKQQEILNSQTQSLFKQNTLLKHQLKESNALNATLNKIVTQLRIQLQTYQLKYQKTKKYINNKLNNQKHNQNYHQNNFTHQRNNNNNQNYQNKNAETPINLIEFKDDFSFKDSIENQNHSILLPNHPPSFLHFQTTNSQRFYASQQSPSRHLRERDILNLTDRDPSTHSKNSKNITKHLLRSKMNLQQDKENISVNTWDYNDFDTYHNEKKVTRISSKRIQNTQKQAPPSNGSMMPSARRFQTQERSSLLSKHRRIKSSFCGKSIHQFQQFENSHFIMNSDKLTESMMENMDRKDGDISECRNNIENESQILGYDVNEIVINEQLISSYKPKTVRNVDDFGNSVEEKDMGGSMDLGVGMIDAKMINSVQVKPQLIVQKQKQKQKPVKPLSSPIPSQMDLYYAFFTLTAQCAKLNHKNFNQAISVYFNLEQEYNNVVKKMIPINKWYNYVHDQIQTSIKYQR